MRDLDELQRLAEGATPGPGESQYTHPRDSNNWKANAAFVQAFDADTAKKLIAVARLADAVVNPPQMTTGYHQRKQREADEAFLRTALEELKWALRNNLLNRT